MGTGVCHGVWGQLTPTWMSAEQLKWRGSRLCWWLLGGMEQIPKYWGTCMQEHGLAIGSRAQGCPKGCGTAGLCCPCRECSNAEAKVTVFAYLTPCFNDCGPYGQCSLLRRHGYLYAGCSCKAGECLSLGSFAILPEGTAQFKMALFEWGSLGSAMASSVTVPGEAKFWGGAAQG